MTCSSCGQVNPLDARFCARCGDRQTSIVQTDAWPRVPWGPRDVVLGLITVVVGTLLVVISMAGAGALNPISLSLGVGVLVVAVWLFAIRKYRAQWGLVGLRLPDSLRSWLWPWLALVASLVFTSAYVAVVAAIGLDLLEPPSVSDVSIGQGLSRLLNMLVIGLLAPFCEEVFFRGFVLSGLVRWLGVTRAAVVTSALFGLAHGAIGVMIPLFVTGLLLSWLYLKTRSLWPAIVAHSAQNWLALLLVT